MVADAPEASGTLISLDEAAALCNAVIGQDDMLQCRPVSSASLRRALRGGRFERYGVAFMAMPGRYYVSRESLTRHMVEHLQACYERAKAEAER